MVRLIYFTFLVFFFSVQKTYADAAETLEKKGSSDRVHMHEKDANALNFLGESHHFGIKNDQHNGTVDFKKAREYYLKAAALGSAAAANHLGRIYLLGEGVPKNEKEAEKWYKKSVALDSSLKNKCLNKKGPLPYILYGLIQASEEGNASAQDTLAHAYSDVYVEGVERNMEEAIRLFECAATQGKVSSMQSLIHIYREKPFLNEDKARFWEEKYQLASRPSPEKSQYVPKKDL